MNITRFKRPDFLPINRIIIYCILLLLVTSYFFITESTINLNNYKIEECKSTLFDYDRIEYYNSDVDDFNGSILNGKDSIKVIMLNNYFTEINDSINLNQIENYYKKNELSLKALEFIKSYICKTKINLNNDYSECMPIFRDIIIFKKQSKTVGILKICFDCNLSNIVSSEYNSYLFNIDELDILEKFLIEKTIPLN
jgi:hypothetical protein